MNAPGLRGDAAASIPTRDAEEGCSPLLPVSYRFSSVPTYLSSSFAQTAQ